MGSLSKLPKAKYLESWIPGYGFLLLLGSFLHTSPTTKRSNTWNWITHSTRQAEGGRDTDGEGKRERERMCDHPENTKGVSTSPSYIVPNSPLRMSSSHSRRAKVICNVEWIRVSRGTRKQRRTKRQDEEAEKKKKEKKSSPIQRMLLYVRLCKRHALSCTDTSTEDNPKWQVGTNPVGQLLHQGESDQCDSPPKSPKPQIHSVQSPAHTVQSYNHWVQSYSSHSPTRAIRHSWLLYLI